jgi:hypothetical protein
VGVELLEQTKRKMGAKLAESQAELKRVEDRGEELEKGKQRLLKELRELKSANEELKENVVYLGKQQKMSEKAILEWRERYVEICSDSLIYL